MTRAAPTPTWPRLLLRPYLRACTVPQAHAHSALAHPAETALAAVRAGHRPDPADLETSGRGPGNARAPTAR
ncbi:hypothetical protein [Streptomyces buecherae]|uniref:hypothetical protein n=1 Tax=Streptomyces buecherae TaxID=2763006 RepID=UPI003665DDAA